MMKKILIGIIIFFSFFQFSNNTFGSQTTFDTLETRYNQFTQKLSIKYNNEKIITILEGLSTSLDGYITKKGISEKNKDYVRFLYDLNRQKINLLKSQDTKNGESEQVSKEYKYIIILKAQSKRTSVPSVITELTKSGKQLYNTNSLFEFYDESSKSVKRISFSSYYNISTNVISLLKETPGIIVSPKEGGYIFIPTYTLEEKHPFSNFYTQSDFSNRFVDLDKGYFLEGKIYYTFTFSKYQVFADEYGYYDSTFTNNHIDVNAINFMRDSEGRFGYIDSFEKVKLISKDLIFGLTNTDKFLDTVKDDKKYLTGDTDSEFKRLKEKVGQIISTSDTKQDKIKKIYTWILNNIHYSKEFSIEDKKIFSGVNTFSVNEGVCDGYVKLMTYMLLYAGVDDVTIIRGDVIDAQDFPYIGHAWLKIGDDYYDPTFDDPIGLTGTLSPSEWRFYKLPRDILYANRFDYADTPESLKTATLETREDLIKRNLYNLTDKYKDDNYLLLEPYIFRKKHDFTYNQILGIDDLKELIPNIEQISNSSIILNGQQQSIHRLSYLYYQVDTAKNIELILESAKYDISKLYLIKTPSGEYRVGYNVVIE